MNRTVRHVAVAATALAMGLAAYLMLSAPQRQAHVPDVAYTLLDGSTHSTAQLQGKVTLVNFWATTCTVCMAEMPRLVALHESLKARGFDTLAVSMSYDPPVYVMRYAESRKLPFGVAIDNTGAIARGFGNIQGTPTSLLIDRHGKVVQRFVGEPDFTALRALIEKLLAEA